MSWVRAWRNDDDGDSRTVELPEDLVEEGHAGYDALCSILLISPYFNFSPWLLSTPKDS